MKVNAVWPNRKTNINGVQNRLNISGCCKSIKKCKKCDWMALNSKLLNFYRTDSNAIFDIAFASLFFTSRSSSQVTI